MTGVTLIMSDLTRIHDIDMPALSEHALDESVAYHGPPGTGKTTTSLGRIGRIIESDDQPYDEADVAWVTYRKSLADDLLDTAADIGLIPEALANDKQLQLDSSVRFWGTLHGVAARAWHDLPDHQIVSEYHKRKFCREVLNEPFETPNPYQDAVGRVILQTIQWCRKNLIDPTDRTEPVKECPHYAEMQYRWGGDLAVAAKRWERYKANAGGEDDTDPIVDFPDLLRVALEKPAVPPTSVLVIDEYHDAYPLFAAVCEQWMQHHDIVIVAGDPHQTINSYRGASPEFFEALDLPVIHLRNSRRVPVEHYAAAMQCLNPAHDLPDVDPTGHGEITEFVAEEPVTQDGSDEWQSPGTNTAGSPGNVHERMQQRADHGDRVMHVTRTRRQAGAVAAALDEAGFAYRTQKGLSDGWGQLVENKRRAVYNVMSAAQQCAVPHGKGAAPPEKISIQSGDAHDAVKAAPAEYIDLHKDAVRALRGRETDADDNNIDMQCEAVAELERWVTPGFFKACENPDTLRRWVGAGKSGESLTERDVSAVAGVLQRRGMGHQFTHRDDLPLIQTVHASKGSEAEHVACYTGATEAITEAMQNDEEEWRNEHRVWYVALTRSSETLYVVHDAIETGDISANGPPVRGVAEPARHIAGGD
jgi:DNA helicase-2/ATP-dependent DNA helicase PcrA